MDNSSNHPSLVRADAFILPLILTAGIIFTADFKTFFDIFLYDESSYLYSGANLLKSGLPAAEDSVLYSVWYYVLSIIKPDRIELFFFNFRLLTIILPLFFYILLRQNKVSPFVSTVMSSLLMIMPVNFLAVPKVSHLALSLIFIIMIFACRARSVLQLFLETSLGSAIVMFIRPEYYLSCLSAFAFFLAVLYSERKNISKLAATGFIAYSLFYFIFLGATGYSLVSGKRSFVAFGQHFSCNWLKSKHIRLSPWNDWNEIVSDVFGPADSIAKAFYNNPQAFLCHIADNEKELIKKIPTAFTILSILSFLFYFSTARANFFLFGNFLIAISIFILPGIISMILFFPRDHYFLITGSLIASALITLLFGGAPETERSIFKQIILPALIVITLIPALNYKYENFQQSNISVIRLIQSLKITGHVNMLEAEGGYYIYIGDNFNWVSPDKKNINFNLFIENEKINMIVVSDQLSMDRRFRDDKQWRAFVKNCAKEGFVKFKISSSDKTIIVKSDLIENKKS